MSLLLFLAFGLVVGLVARALLPGEQPMGLLTTMGLGIAGSFTGGFLASILAGHRVLDFHTTGLIGSVLGAIVVLAVFGAVSRRGARV